MIEENESDVANTDFELLAKVKTKKLFGYPQPPTLIFENWKNCTKSIPHLLFRIPKKGFFSLRILIF